MDAGMVPVMAEDLSASSGTPQDVVLIGELGSCDAIVGIYGQRYGWAGARSGISPTEEEYNYARDAWIPIYGFIDAIDGGRFDPRQAEFLRRVQNWDVGITRNEFYTLDDLYDLIVIALTQSDQTPRYRTFLAHLRRQAMRSGYRRIRETRLPACDELLHKPGSGVHMTFDPEKLVAVVNGDAYDQPEIQHICALWKETLLDYFRPSVWNQTSLEAFMVVAVERNPYGHRGEQLPRERSASAGGFYGMVVDLMSATYSHPKLRLKDRGVTTLLIDPLVAPALEPLR